MSVCGQVVDKQELKKIRGKITSLLDENCSECFIKANNIRSNGNVAAYKYCNKKCQVGKKLQELGNSLGDEKSPIWSNDEVNYLLNHYKLFSIDHLAERLGRSPEAVEIKLKRFLNPPRKKKDAV